MCVKIIYLNHYRQDYEDTKKHYFSPIAILYKCEQQDVITSHMVNWSREEEHSNKLQWNYKSA